MTSLVASNTKKRNRKETNDKLCHFCQSTPTALVVRVPAIRSRKASPSQTYCLLHYYTTSASQLDTKYVTIQDQKELELQLPAVQDMFSEAYVQLQQELSEESARAFTQHKHDPLAILHDLNKSTRNVGSKEKRQADAIGGGGFMRSVPLPSRLMQTQQQQAVAQREMIRRMSASQKQKSRPSDFSKRRKGSRMSIWNAILDGADDSQKASHKNKVKNAHASEPKDGGNQDERAQGITCTCGSEDVNIVGSNSSRNQEATKGEIWGNKDRGAVTRYQCCKCARTWNEEE